MSGMYNLQPYVVLTTYEKPAFESLELIQASVYHPLRCAAGLYHCASVGQSANYFHTTHELDRGLRTNPHVRGL